MSTKHMGKIILFIIFPSLAPKREHLGKGSCVVPRGFFSVYTSLEDKEEHFSATTFEVILNLVITQVVAVNVR